MSLFSRRGLLIGASAFLAAPAIVRAENIMKVRSVKLPANPLFIGRSSVSQLFPLGGRLFIEDGETGNWREIEMIEIVHVHQPIPGTAFW